MEGNRINKPNLITKYGTIKPINHFVVTNDDNGNTFISLVCDMYENKVYKYNCEQDLYVSSDNEIIFFNVTESNRECLKYRLDEVYGKLCQKLEVEKSKIEMELTEIKMTKESLGL